MTDTWTPREGAYGRTRDGQKVGPLQNHWNRGFVETVGDGRWWQSNGCGWRDGELSPSIDLVAEWVDDGPVRTVTRQEIVPGTYGRLGVGGAFGGVVAVGIGARNQYLMLDADELDAAACVLAQLAEALRNGQ